MVPALSFIMCCQHCPRFMGIAEQMGRVLQRTSISVNIKERLDFSCALFGPDGEWLTTTAATDAKPAALTIPLTYCPTHCHSTRTSSFLPVIRLYCMLLSMSICWCVVSNRVPGGQCPSPPCPPGGNVGGGALPGGLLWPWRPGGAGGATGEWQQHGGRVGTQGNRGVGTGKPVHRKTTSHWHHAGNAELSTGSQQQNKRAHCGNHGILCVQPCTAQCQKWSWPKTVDITCNDVLFTLCMFAGG